MSAYVSGLYSATMPKVCQPCLRTRVSYVSSPYSGEGEGRLLTCVATEGPLRGLRQCGASLRQFLMKQSLPAEEGSPARFE